MTKYDKELDTRTKEYDKAIEPLNDERDAPREQSPNQTVRPDEEVTDENREAE